MNLKLIDDFYNDLPELYQTRVDDSIKIIVDAHKENKKISVVTGSGPNIHEGVTTLIAELINKGIINGGVLTSSAVVGHEMGGALDRVRRVDGKLLDFKGRDVWLPKGDVFEANILTEETLKMLEKEMDIDRDLINQINNTEGKKIIKAAGNMAYPVGLRNELLSEEILTICKEKNMTLEYIVGLGADPLTMIGAGARNNIPISVSIPQLVGSGMIGMSVGDSISIHERSILNSKILGGSDVIIESGLALAQEIHDGPLESYTGHGVWSQWNNEDVYSLQNKKLLRIDLDTNLEKVWQQQRQSSLVQKAIDDGKPKTKLSGVPFRMEMSGFARLEGSVPIIGDLGEIWPIIASRVSKDLGIKLDFMSYKQETDEGKKMREFIVDNVGIVDKQLMLAEVAKLD